MWDQENAEIPLGNSTHKESGEELYNSFFLIGYNYNELKQALA